MNPITAAKEIEEQLRNYIRRSCPVERADERLSPLIERMFEKHRLALPPYLELLPNYQRGPSLAQMRNDDVLRDETVRLFSKALADDDSEQTLNRFHLYSHQAESIRAVIQEDRNLIVCSGTGSGKTECFLVPLIEHLMQLKAENMLQGAGVQAMILYPMNALVNDQIRRLRKLLRYAPDIRFGKFTGELDSISDEESVNDPREIEGMQNVIQSLNIWPTQPWTGAGFDDESPLPNEVTTRSGWYENPAHILVTNYSMLERLLLKPESSGLFESDWKYIVLDEAHCYSGGLGTEIAWLLRRLKRRLGNPGSLRFMATSATLIDDPNLNQEQRVEKIRSEFATQLFPSGGVDFHVEFGTTTEFEAPAGSYAWDNLSLTPTQYREIYDQLLTDAEAETLRNDLGDHEKLISSTERSLFGITQQLIGSERFVKSLVDTMSMFKRAIEHDLPLALGDVSFLLNQMHAAVQSKVIHCDVDPETMWQGFLNAGSFTAIRRMIEFLGGAVGQVRVIQVGGGQITPWKFWREWLHDHSDPRPSSVPNDVINVNNGNRNAPQTRPNPIGNRLHILYEWGDVLNGNTTRLTLEGLGYLVRSFKNATSLAESDYDVNVNDGQNFAVKLSEATRQSLLSVSTSLHVAKETLQDVRDYVSSRWRKTIQQFIQGDAPPNLELEQLLAWFLGGDARVVQTANILRGAIGNPETASQCEFLRVAEAIFPEPDLDASARSEALVALVGLASLAIPSEPPGNRRPLLDLRYHQLVRGLLELGIAFSAENGVAVPHSVQRSDATTVTLDGQHGDVSLFTLGFCRDCGQPYALVYAKVAEINAGAGEVPLSRVASGTTPYLHAFAWRESIPQNPEQDFPKEPTQNIWLNVRTGMASSQNNMPHGDPSWINVHWYVRSAQNNPTFLRECPCCGGASQQASADFGIITPYSAYGMQTRLVLLDQLFRQVDPSLDPITRNQEGKGRSSFKTCLD